ncbi:hypothetical protein TNCV_1658651 [Trichonephila clavipes]|nr:hypothetical protein TNCV_1658651 [Trichonephila clavipes]
MPRVKSRNAYQHVFDFDCGLTYNSIPTCVGRDPMTVSKIWNRWFRDGNTGCRAGSQRLLSLAPEKTDMLPAWP